MTLLLERILHLFVLRIQFRLGLRQLGLLLLDLLLEDMLHVLLHLHELGLMQCTLLLQLGQRIDLSKDSVILLVAHAEQLLGTVVLVVDVVCELTELLHVGPDQHLAQLDKVAVLLVINLDGAPRVLTTAHMATVSGLDDLVRSNNGERNLALYS